MRSRVSGDADDQGQLPVHLHRTQPDAVCLFQYQPIRTEWVLTLLARPPHDRRLT